MAFTLEEKATTRMKCCQCGKEQRFIAGEKTICQFCGNTIMVLLKPY